MPTVGDSTDETDGSVTVTINTGTNYTPGSPSTASVTVNDDDDPPPPPPPPPPPAPPAPPAPPPVVEPVGLVVVGSGESTVVVSDGFSGGVYEVSLSVRPDAVVVVAVSTSGGLVVTVDGVSGSDAVLRFTPDDWDEPQQVAVTAPQQAGVGGYRDVEASDYFAAGVLWGVTEGVIETSGVCFGPAAVVTRAQAAVWMWNTAGRPEAPPHRFDDVPAVLDEAVSWLSHSGVTTGTSPTTFDPDAVLTRAQLITLLWRFAGQPEAPPHPFDDITAAWQQDAVSWAAHSGVTTGTSPTTFDPDTALTRAQLIALLWRYLGEPAATNPAATVTYRVSSTDPRFNTLPVQTIRITVNPVDPDATATRGQAIYHIWDIAGRPPQTTPHNFEDINNIHNTAARWATHTGITTAATTFNPDTPITRAQLITLLWRLAGQPQTPPHPYTDITTPWQQQPISWATHTNITPTTTSETTYNPDTPLTHQQLNTIINQYTKHTCNQPPPPTPTN